MLLRLVVVVVLAAMAGLVALVAVAAASERPGLFLGAGLVVFLAATAAGAGVATRKLPSGRGRTRLAPFAGGALAGVVVFVATALLPVGDPRLPPAPVAGQGFWELPTGSRIAYVHLPARGGPRPAPVVFLHGGPGVADLEAIRGRIGADRLVLIRHSWGGQVAAGVRTRLTAGQQLGLYRLLLRPRVLLGWTLLQVNPRAAHAFVGDAEMDARNDRVYNHGRAGAHCRGAPPGPALHGLGFYAYQFPQSAAARPWADPRPQLTRLSTPALVIKGSCDYLSWATGVAYRQALTAAQLVCLRRAGHNAYQDQPAAFLEVVRAFLTGRPLPVAPWTGGVPADYEGPPR